MASLLYPLPEGFKVRESKRSRPKARPGQPKMPPIQREATEQRALISWASLAVKMQPDLRWLYHVPNGGKRGKAEAGMLKAEGVKKGIPDLHLPVRRGIYTGLRIELKSTGSVPSDMTPEQKEWLEHFQGQGEFAVGVNGWELARDLIQAYLALEDGCAFPTGRYNLPIKTWIACKSTARNEHAHSPASPATAGRRGHRGD